MKVTGIFILEKIYFNHDGSKDSSNCSAFSSFWAANRAMNNDFLSEYCSRPDAPKKGELFVKSKHDPDGFWEGQPSPFERDTESRIEFRDGRWIEWKIFKRDVEELSSDWDDKPGFDPMIGDDE